MCKCCMYIEAVTTTDALGMDECTRGAICNLQRTQIDFPADWITIMHSNTFTHEIHSYTCTVDDAFA